MILHTLNKTRTQEDINHQLSENICRSDSVILIEDGAYQALTITHCSLAHWSNVAKQVYILKDDALARGIPLDLESLSYIDYKEFVALAVSHNKVISWY